MKTIALIVSRVKQYWLNHRNMLVLFLLGGILNSLVFSYLYGNCVTYLVRRDATEYYYRQYTVYYTDHSAFSLDRIQEMNQPELIESVMVCSQLSNGEYSITADLSDSPTIVCEKGSIDLSAAEHPVIIPSDASGTVGDAITLSDQEFLVIGQHTLSGYYIKYEDFAASDLSATKLFVLAAKRQDLSDDPVQDLIAEFFPGAYIKTPKIYETYDQNSMPAEIIQISIVYGISLCSYLFLLRYMMDSMLNYTVTCMVVGASKKKIFAITMLEIMALCVFADCVGILMHQILYPVLFSKINISENLVYNGGDYFTIFTAMFLVNAVVAVPFTIKYARLSPAESRRHAG